MPKPKRRVGKVRSRHDRGGGGGKGPNHSHDSVPDAVIGARCSKPRGQMMSEPAEVNGADRFSEAACLPVDWLVRELAPAVFAATGLTDDAADLDQLPELTPAMFNWPGLLDRASRILTCAAAVLLETFLAEHRAHPRELTESEYDVLRAGIGVEALEMADAARISVLPHLIGQHAYRGIAVGVQLLHFRGPASAELRSLRDIAVTSVLEVQQQRDELATTTELSPTLDRFSGRTARPLPVWVPQPRLGT